MDKSQKIAVVTGSNKGIGYELVKGLCQKFNGIVYLTARNLKKGKDATEKLKQLGYNPQFHQLDITDQSSLERFAEHIKTNHGGLDLLINNAAICFPIGAKEPFAEQAEQTLAVNYFGTLRVCNALFPLLRNNARVVNISSSAGHLYRIPSLGLREKLSDPKLTIQKLNELLQEFLSDTKTNTYFEHGWGKSAYSVSKVGVSALTRIQQRIFDNEGLSRNILVNSVHPGYINTDINEHHGTLTVQEGTKAPLFLAVGDHNLKGAYVWYDCQVVEWTASATPTRH